MKLLVAGASVVALGLLTAGCSGGSGSKAAASSASAAATSAAAIAAPSTSAVASSPAAAVSSSAPPTGSPSTAQPTATGTSAPSAATTTTAASAAPSTAGAAGAAPGGKTGPVVVCTTLPTSQVATLSGRALTSSREQDYGADNSYTCNYFTASGTGGLSVTVSQMQGAIKYANTLSTDKIAGAAENVTPVAGLGDKAFSAHDGLHVLFGDRLITVAGLTSVPPAEAIVNALQAKLG